MRKSDRNENRLYRQNKKRLFEKGFSVSENLIINTWDYNFKELLEVPIKDFKEKELKISWETEDPDYYQSQIKAEPIFKDIKGLDLIYGDWWRIGNIKKDIMKYVVVSSPYVRDVNKGINFEIKSLINSHYHKIYGYEYPYYIPQTFQKIKEGSNKGMYELKFSQKYGEVKDTYDKIEEWIEKNKDSKEYKYYKSIIEEQNNKCLELKEPYKYINKYDVQKYSINLVLPIGYSMTYKELFDKALNTEEFETKKTDIYSEEEIEKYLDNTEEWRVFLEQFIPKFNKPMLIKRKKRRFKK